MKRKKKDLGVSLSGTAAGADLIKEEQREKEIQEAEVKKALNKMKKKKAARIDGIPMKV